MTAACPVPRANSRAASKRRASNAATSRRPCRLLTMPQHGIVPDEDHQSISRESLAVQAASASDSSWARWTRRKRHEHVKAQDRTGINGGDYEWESIPV